MRWKRDWHPLHSSSGKPDTPGQYGVQGVKALVDDEEILKGENKKFIAIITIVVQ